LFITRKNKNHVLRARYGYRATIYATVARILQLYRTSRMILTQ